MLLKISSAGVPLSSLKTESSWCQLSRYWWHSGLPWRQPTVPPATINLSSWQSSTFSVIPKRVELTGLISIGFMMTSSNGNIFRVAGHLCRIYRSTVNSPHKGQWCGSLIFSLIYAWINGWVNSREAGDLRRHRAHYDVTVMLKGMKPLLTIFSVSEILLLQKSLSLTTQQLLCYWNDFYLTIDLLLGILF